MEGDPMVQGKTIIVTGAAGGMGQATVECLLEAGAAVVACDLQTGKLKTLSSGGNFLPIAGDLTDEVHVKEIFKTTVEKFKSFDVLVNCQGIAQSAAPIEEVSLTTYQKLMNVNMTTLFLTCKEAVLYMKQQKQGHSINIGSVATTRPRPGLQCYVASKGAAEAFTKALALELASSGVRANVIHPWPSDTAMLGEFTAEGAEDR